LEFIGESNHLLTADKIERRVKSVLYEDREVRKKVQEISEICKKILLEGGSLVSDLGIFLFVLPWFYLILHLF